jgi:hypothetical protein
MSEQGDVRAEVAELRQEVAAVREESAGTRTLVALYDRDAGDVRAAQAGIVAGLNALRETQLEQGQVLAEHGRVLGLLVVEQCRHTERLDHLATRQDQQGERLDHLTTTVNTIATRQDQQGAVLAEILRRLPPETPR